MPRDPASLDRPLRRWHRAWKDRWLAEGGAAARRGATIDMLVFDHGLVRYAWRNLHEIAPGVWRGSQPDPGMIRRLAARGFRTILNLRGETEWGSYLLEREACAELGIELVDLKLNSRSLPTVETILALDAIFARAAKPMLIHCKSGSDRAGFVSALYLLLRTGATPEEAGAQLSWRYLHLRRGGTGVLGFMIEAYAAERARSGIAFRDWLATGYDREALTAAFEGGAMAGFVTDRVLGRE
ncbi:MAG: protein tyrosine phosphatase [Rhodovulum sulfidophilum]|uniref:Protein tyrosine phosphatase n=1 Tax=Rhodovulum sulfidophilum TaxID=35806 RepID=A0A2W5NFA1_RHOSU|nr:MAG: protein tyrosine phosphatase [Rhodovulum sulfidophilum]